MQRKSKLSKIFWKISYNNQNNNNILGKKKNFLAFILNDPRSKKIYQKTANTKSKFVPIPMQDKKKRTTHPEIWILENRNRGFATTYRNMHFFCYFFPLFFPTSPPPFLHGTRRMEIELCARRYWRIRQVYDGNNGATRNWKLGIGTPPVECIANFCNFVMGGWNSRGSR